jgi:hypothetical protein
MFTKFKLFVNSLIPIILSWIIVDLWGRVLDSFTYSYLKCDRNNFKYPLILALLVTFVLVCYIFILNMKDDDECEDVRSNVVDHTSFSLVSLAGG